MSYEELEPRELIRRGLRSDSLVKSAWTVDWSLTEDPRALLAEGLGPVLDFRTSGTTSVGGSSWRRTWEQAWSEAGLLADLLIRGGAPEAVLSFAPPRHFYGTLVSVLVPARLGLPVWYRPEFAPMPPERPHRRWAVMAIPWAFQILRRRPVWLRSAERLTLLHSTASLPASARGLLADVGPDRATLTEIFGSTESGGVAHRDPLSPDQEWTLFEDVEFASGVGGPDTPLRVRSPRLAFSQGETPPEECRLDDHVQITGLKSFRFFGRRERLVNVNGVRLDLDSLEDPLREALPCPDLACVPVHDDLAGEHFELLIAVGSASAPPASVLEAALSLLPVRPRAVRVVERIDRSETGKLRKLA